MVKRISTFWISLALLCTMAGEASAGWDRPEWRTRVEGFSTSDLFPGYEFTQGDRGVAVDGEVESATRLNAVKLGVVGRGGVVGFSHFSEAGYGWIGGRVHTRARSTRLLLDVEWIPERVKFPADPENASFSRTGVSLGLQQSVGGRIGLRISGLTEFDDYVPSFDGRDATALFAVGVVSWRATEAIELHLRGELGGRDTSSPDYAFGQTETGGGLRWIGPPWIVSGALRTGVRKYTEAPRSDSNYRRRDQWIELRGSLERRFVSALSGRLAVEFRDRTSSRPDRTYQVTTFRLGVQWAGGSQ